MPWPTAARGSCFTAPAARLPAAPRPQARFTPGSLPTGTFLSGGGGGHGNAHGHGSSASLGLPPHPPHHGQSAPQPIPGGRAYDLHHHHHHHLGAGSSSPPLSYQDGSFPTPSGDGAHGHGGGVLGPAASMPCPDHLSRTAPHLPSGLAAATISPDLLPLLKEIWNK